MNANGLVEKYVALRDRKKEMQERHKEELKPFEAAMESLENLLMKQLNESGADSLKTPSGTCYKQKWTAARVADWQKVLDYAMENGRLDLFERRVNKSVVEEIGAVPGVEMDFGIKVNIRRS
jgi:hypothetical protein